MPMTMGGGSGAGIPQQARKKDTGYYKAIQSGQKGLASALKELKVNRVEQAA